MVKTPILFEPIRPIRKEGYRIQLLDETQLPDHETWVSISSLRELLKAVADMKTRAFGQVLALAYGFILGKSEGWTPEEVIGAFSRSRPTFPFEAIGRQILASANETSDITQAALSFIEATLALRRKRAERLAQLLPDRAHILTHCHISGELGLALSIAKEAGKRLKVYPTVTRPYGQGVRLSAPESLSVGVETEIIADNAVYQAFKEKGINLVVLGSDRSSQQGDILNKVGSFAISFLARSFQVPVFTLVQEMGSDKNLPSPLPIEFRAPEEANPPEYSPKVPYLYPAFDMVPMSFIDLRVGFLDTYERHGVSPYEPPNTFSVCPQKDQRVPPTPFSLLIGQPIPKAKETLIQRLKKGHKPILILEGLPCFSGVFLAEELKEEGLEVWLACDLMAGFFFSAGMIERAYLGIHPDGQENPIKGGALISLLAQAYKTPLETFEAAPDTRSQGDVFRTFGASSLKGKVPVFFGEPYERSS